VNNGARALQAGFDESSIGDGADSIRMLRGFAVNAEGGPIFGAKGPYNGLTEVAGTARHDYRHLSCPACAVMRQNGTMPSGHQVQIRTARESDAESIREAVMAIAAEKWYLATLDGFSLEETRAFLRRIVEGNLLQVTAFVEDKVVGFCDILPNPAPGFTHIARLGMGVLLEWRRHGIGRRLLEACLALAKNAHLEKVELEVFSDNIAAIRLYESFGFSREGVRVRSRKLDGRYQDLELMALWL
jgi:ribosomal protein S18 acetylase RimI-like enzyme